MVKGRIIFASTAIALLGAAAAGAPARKPAARDAGDNNQLMQSCDAHKFETVVQEMVDGQPHQSKVKLCGKEGQSDADWIRTLKDAVAKLDSNEQMPKAVRNQIVTALNREIMRLSAPVSPHGSADETFGGVPVAALGTLSTKPKSVPQATSGEGYSSLPPVFGDAGAAGGALPPPRQAAPQAAPSDYAALPPLPAAPPPPIHVLAGAGSTMAAALPMPRMTFSCFSPGENIGGPCTGFTRDTLLTIRADEDLPAGTSLRFVRDGDPKIDVALAQLKRGKSMQLAVPADVCRHVVGGKLELRIVRAGQEVGSDGPYNLDC